MSVIKVLNKINKEKLELSSEVLELTTMSDFEVIFDSYKNQKILKLLFLKSFNH